MLAVINSNRFDNCIRTIGSPGAQCMPTPCPSLSDKLPPFHELDQSGVFVIPNPWDIGSALFLQTLGFKALATTSSGFAWSQGRPDGGISRGTTLAHLFDIAAATNLP